MERRKLTPSRFSIGGAPSLVAIAAASLVCYFAFLSALPTLSTMRLKIVDGFYERRHAVLVKDRKSVEDRIVIAAIDNTSVRRLKERWPWRRSVMARFLDSVTPLGPRVVAFDLSFSVPSRRAEDDVLFARSIRSHGHVVLGAYFADDGKYVGPIGALEEAASVGFLNMPRDMDGVNRHVRAEIPESRGKLHAFGLRVVSEFLGKDPAVIAAETAVESKEPHWVAYDFREADLKVIPFWRFLENGVAQRVVKDKILVVGTTGEIFHDRYPTPLGVMPGVMMHANHILQHLDEVAIRLPRKDGFYAALVVLVSLFALLFRRLGFGVGLLALVLLLGVLYEGLARLFLRGVLLDPMAVFVTVILAYAWATIWRSLALFAENLGLREEARKDGLTGLYTYRYLESRLKDEFDRARKSGKPLSFVIFDLDRFKEINDRYGHEQGNEILVEFSKILRSFIRGEDLVARYGGEEFCLVLPHRDRAAAHLIADRIRTALKRYAFSFRDKLEGRETSVQITVSAGICSTEDSRVFNGKELLRLADQALLDAKQKGRDRVLIYGN